MLSYASMGANSVFNLLRGGEHLLLAEGLSIFPSSIPASTAGRTLGESKIRTRTGCTVIAVEDGSTRELNPGLDCVLPTGGRIFLVGTLEAEDRFLEAFHPAKAPSRSRVALIRPRRAQQSALPVVPARRRPPGRLLLYRLRRWRASWNCCGIRGSLRAPVLIATMCDSLGAGRGVRCVAPERYRT